MPHFPGVVPGNSRGDGKGHGDAIHGCLESAAAGRSAPHPGQRRLPRGFGSCPGGLGHAAPTH